MGPQTRSIRYDPGAPSTSGICSTPGSLAQRTARCSRTWRSRSTASSVGTSTRARRCAPTAAGADRLRQRLPGLAGDLAALPLPLAGHGEGAVGAVLRHHQAAHEDQPRLGRHTSRSPATACHTASACRLRRIARERFETERFQEFCDTTLADLDEVATSFFGRRDAREAVARRSSPYSPSTSGIGSPTISGGSSSSGVTTTDGVKPERVHRVVLGQTGSTSQWPGGGHWGTPILRLSHRRRRRRRDRADGAHRRALAPDRGRTRIKVYSCDSVAGRSWLVGADPRHSPGSRASSTGSSTRSWCPPSGPTVPTADIEIIAAGASIGAFNAVASLCRHPWTFRAAIGMSGTYDLGAWLHGTFGRRRLLLRSPLHFFATWLEGDSSISSGGDSCVLATGRGVGRTRGDLEDGPRPRGEEHPQSRRSLGP